MNPTLNQEEKALRDHIEKLNAELAEKTNVRDELDQEIARLNGVKEASLSDVKTLSNTRDNIVAEFETISEQLNTTQSQIEDNLVKRKLELEKEVEALKVELSNLEGSVKVSAGINDSLKITKDQLEASVANLAKVRDSYIELNNKANSEYSAKTSSIKDLDMQIMSLQSDVKALIEEKTAKSNEIGAVEAEVVALRKEEYKLKQNIEVMKAREAEITSKEAILKEKFEEQGLKYEG